MQILIWSCGATLHVPIQNIHSLEEVTSKFSNHDFVIVDAIYGTGFHGELNQSAKLATQWINNSAVPIFALDILKRFKW